MEDSENGDGTQNECVRALSVYRGSRNSWRKGPVTSKQEVSQKDPAVLCIQLNKMN